MAASHDPHLELANAISSRHEKLTSADAAKEVIMSLREHMIDISGNPEGSDPTEYLELDESLILEEFVKVQDSLGWPGSEPIQMLHHRIPRRAAWKHQSRPARSGVDKAIFFKPVRAPIRGVRFAKLRLPLGQAVAIAEDGKLYSLRGRELGTSYGFGWGALPDRACLDAVIAPDSPLYYGQPANLSTVLAGKIPPPKA